MAFASYGDGMHYLQGVGWWGLMTVGAIALAGGEKFGDMSHIAKNPWKIGAWFLTGCTIAALTNVLKLKERGYDKRNYILHKRVSENEQTHALLRNMRFHLYSRSKMTVWDANPQ